MRPPVGGVKTEPVGSDSLAKPSMKSLSLIAMLASMTVLASGPDQRWMSTVPQANEACAGVSLYYDHEDPCSWSRAITSTTPSVPFTIEQLFLERQEDGGWGYGRYQVATMDATRQLGVFAARLRSETTDSYAERVGLMYAQWPRFLRLIIPYDLMIRDDETGGYFPRYCNRSIRHTGCGWVGDAAHNIAMPESHYTTYLGDQAELAPEFEELVLHELGHALWYGTPDWWNESAWRAAVEKDGGAYISDYAATSEGEDFAESFAAWVIYRAYRQNIQRPARDNILRIRSRIHYFDDRLRDALTKISGG